MKTNYTIMNNFSRLLYSLAFLVVTLITTSLMMNSSDSEPGRKAFQPNNSDDFIDFDTYNPTTAAVVFE